MIATARNPAFKNKFRTPLFLIHFLSGLSWLATYLFIERGDLNLKISFVLIPLFMISSVLILILYWRQQSGIRKIYFICLSVFILLLTIMLVFFASFLFKSNFF